MFTEAEQANFERDMAERKAARLAREREREVAAAAADVLPDVTAASQRGDLVVTDRNGRGEAIHAGRVCSRESHVHPLYGAQDYIRVDITFNRNRHDHTAQRLVRMA